ncbi:hypothetical protein FDP41_000580 [Naegleria fowleri]|uniref:RGS domain-containing protein n=1 Tax=Naegleria fowleri TaxID=5763 RepID=A0A6A5CBN0_NAEFO|nr:uncharacterized protein FDP41_000580 [Naegleria fowleri]KAF0984681.1 hypothetical protein FDP41_000580 [Naegleria fowleri]CAG4718085.1 unnamed protein product [Naegleria fowleri]
MSTASNSPSATERRDNLGVSSSSKSKTNTTILTLGELEPSSCSSSSSTLVSSSSYSQQQFIQFSAQPPSNSQITNETKRKLSSTSSDKEGHKSIFSKYGRNKKKPSFDIHHYMIIYEELMNCPEARDNFQEFLSESYSEDPMIFLQEISHYRQQYELARDFIMKEYKATASASKSDNSMNQACPSSLNTSMSMSSSSSSFVSSSSSGVDSPFPYGPTAVNDATVEPESVTLIESEEMIEECFSYLFILYQMLGHIIETYMNPEGAKGLNLTRTQTSGLYEQYEIISNIMKKASNLKRRKSSKSPVNDILEFVATTRGENLARRPSFDVPLGFCPLQVLNLFEPNSLFKTVEFAVNLDLKTDQFSRYSRSQKMAKFLLKKGEEFTRSIAVNISGGFVLDIRYKLKDFSSKLLTDRDIFFAFSLMEDTPDWELLTYTEKPNICQSFISKTSYMIGKSDSSKGMRIYKIILHLDYPVEDVWAAFCDIDVRSRLDKNLKSIEPTGFQSPSKIGAEKAAKISYESANRDTEEKIFSLEHPPLALQFCKCMIDLKLPFFKTRFFQGTQTSFYDPGIESYVSIGHTADNGEVPNSCVLNKCLYTFVFQRVGEKSTRLIHTVYTDLELRFNPILLTKKVFKQRTAILQNGYETLLKELTQNGTKSVISTNGLRDVLFYNRAVQENAAMYPNRSWFKEYESRKHVNKR